MPGKHRQSRARRHWPVENYLTCCHDRGYDASYRFSEAYSGLSLERPELDKLRELVRTEAIDVLVCYSLDRMSRDPVHGVIITQELEKHHVRLEAVTETVDSTEAGKLIICIRDLAAKLEAEKIKERSVRGRKACAREGRIPGGFHTTCGYHCIRTIRGERQAGLNVPMFLMCSARLLNPRMINN